MAALSLQTGVQTSNAPVVLATATLTASDTFAYTPGAGQFLLLMNNTAGALTAVLTGSAPSAAIPVLGYGTVSAAGGKSVALAVGAVVLIDLDDIAQYLAGSGTVTITGATAAKASFYSAS